MICNVWFGPHGFSGGNIKEVREIIKQEEEAAIFEGVVVFHKDGSKQFARCSVYEYERGLRQLEIVNLLKNSKDLLTRVQASGSVYEELG